jgi:hypothetical protein
LSGACCVAVSAFYAEHRNNKISVDGYIWTKSKFLGLSIGVHMIGQAVISLLDYDEEYVVTFPNGYGRYACLCFLRRPVSYCKTFYLELLRQEQTMLVDEIFGCWQFLTAIISARRSILTVPWVELGGTTEITCAKTGFRTQVEFHTKVCLIGMPASVCLSVWFSTAFLCSSKCVFELAVGDKRM